MLLILMSCLEGAWYPRVWTLDSLPADMNDPVEIPCTAPDTVWTAVILEVTLSHPTPVSVAFRDPSCAENVFRQEVSAGETVSIDTNLGSVWVAREQDGTYIDHRKLREEGTTTWEIQ